MPLKQSASNKAREENVKQEIAAGKDPKQAVAIGYAVQRRVRAIQASREAANPMPPRGGRKGGCK